MKKRTAIFILLGLVLSSFLAMPDLNVKAQGETPHVIGSTLPINAELRDRVDAWLGPNPPSNNIYFAITYWQQHGLDANYVSLVGLNIVSPDENWSFTGDETTGETKVDWFGTILLHDDGSAEIVSTSAHAFNPPKLAMPILPSPSQGPGGGAYVRFPWQPQKGVLFGILGVHSIGYGQDANSGWRAVDLVSGTDLGSGRADDLVYASTTGTVDYVCQDSVTTAIKVSGGGDEFLYAHMLDNANLTIGHTFPSGGIIGSLKHGSFAGDLIGNCGYAAQTAEHWHLHWGFIMAGDLVGGVFLNGRFQAEGCILRERSVSAPIPNNLPGEDQSIGSAGAWFCGNTIIKTREMLTHYGDIPGNDTGSQTMDVRFFDLLVMGLRSLFDSLIGNTLPEHNTETVIFITPILNGVKIAFRIVNILVRGNFNLAPDMAMIVLTITFTTILNIFTTIISIVRVIKSVPFIP